MSNPYQSPTTESTGGSKPVPATPLAVGASVLASMLLPLVSFAVVMVIRYAFSLPTRTTVLMYFVLAYPVVTALATVLMARKTNGSMAGVYAFAVVAALLSLVQLALAYSVGGFAVVFGI